MQRKVARILAVIVGLLFVFSAVSKLVTIGTFEVLLIEQGLAGSRPVAGYLGRFLIAVELFLGIGLCRRALLRRVFMPATAVMLVGFSIYLLHVGFVQGSAEDCGCFGGVLEMSPLSALVKNVVMLGMLGYAWAKSRPDPEGRWKLIVAMGACSFLAVFAFSPVRRPVGKAEATGEPRPEFVEIQQLADSEDFRLLEGEVLVALLSPGCDHCRVVARELGEFARTSPPAPPIYFVFLGEADLVPEFFASTNTDFPHVVSPPEVFLKLIGTAPPRVYRLREGRVVTYWDEENFSRKKLRNAGP